MSADGSERDERREDAIVRAAVRAAKERDREHEEAASASAAPSGGGGSGACPDPESLAAFHERRLPPKDARAVEEHAAECARCAEALRFLGAALPGEAVLADRGAVVARRNRLALAIGIAAVVLLVLGARFLFVASGGGEWGASRALASGGVVVVARGGAAVAGRSEPLLPGESLAAGVRVVLGSAGEIVVATESGFVSLSARGRARPLGPDDADAGRVSRAIAALEATRGARLDTAVALAPRTAGPALAPLYPLGAVVETRPDFALSGPSESSYVLRLDRTGAAAGPVFRVGPVRFPCPYPPGEPALEPGTSYRWTLETAEGRVASVSAFRLATAEEAERARAAVEAAARAAGGDAGGPGVARPLSWIALGFPAEGLRVGAAVARGGGVARAFLHELGIAARALQVEPLAALFLAER